MGWEMKETCGMFALSCWDAAVLVNEVEHIGEPLWADTEKCYPGHCTMWGRELMQTLPSEPRVSISGTCLDLQVPKQGSRKAIAQIPVVTGSQEVQMDSFGSFFVVM